MLWIFYLDYPLSSKQILMFLSLFHICMYHIWITAMIGMEIINNVIHCKYQIQYRSFSVHGRGERDKKIGGGGRQRSTKQIRGDSKSILRAIATNVLCFPAVGEWTWHCTFMALRDKQPGLKTWYLYNRRNGGRHSYFFPSVLTNSFEMRVRVINQPIVNVCLTSFCILTNGNQLGCISLMAWEVRWVDHAK